MRAVGPGTVGMDTGCLPLTDGRESGGNGWAGGSHSADLWPHTPSPPGAAGRCADGVSLQVACHLSERIGTGGDSLSLGGEEDSLGAEPEGRREGEMPLNLTEQKT